jgi:CRP/FNR family transcriptional regulator, cyclic AMP receptor protein
MRTLDEVIPESPVFAGLAPDQLELIAGCASNARFTDGERLFREGEPADDFYLVRHGRVSLDLFVPNRGPVAIDTIEPGEIVGWSWLFPPYRWHFDGRAVGLVRATRFDAACLRGKCDDDTALGYALISRFAGLLLGRLQATRIQLLDVYGDGNR